MSAPYRVVQPYWDPRGRPKYRESSVLSSHPTVRDASAALDAISQTLRPLRPLNPPSLP
jgi:hypothetical protein